MISFHVSNTRCSLSKLVVSRETSPLVTGALDETNGTNDQDVKDGSLTAEATVENRRYWIRDIGSNQ
jgi:hypothetical protein